MEVVNGSISPTSEFTGGSMTRPPLMISKELLGLLWLFFWRVHMQFFTPVALWTLREAILRKVFEIDSIAPSVEPKCKYVNICLFARAGVARQCHKLVCSVDALKYENKIRSYPVNSTPTGQWWIQVLEEHSSSGSNVVLLKLGWSSGWDADGNPNVYEHKAVIFYV